MSDFIYKNGKYYRKNSDGSLTEVSISNDGYFTWTLNDGQVVRTKKNFTEIDTPDESSIDNNLIHKIFNWGLARSGGTNNVGDALSALFLNLHPKYDTRYYDGRIHKPVYYPTRSKKYNDRHATTELETKTYSKNKNYIRAASISDFTGFLAAPTRGRYQTGEYSNAPAVIDRFYTDTIYVPTKAKSIFNDNIGKTYSLTTDSTLNEKVDWNYIDDTYDARNHWITFGKDKFPYVFFQDVFNTNKDFIDKKLIPIIVNQKVPVEFTDDEEKLNRVSYLSLWFLNPRDVKSNTLD